MFLHCITCISSRVNADPPPQRTEALERARAEIRRLQQERERYEESMRKAFMRGVCALNIEAMSMFHGPDERQERGQPGP